MVGKYGGGNRAGLHPHGAEDGEDFRGGTAAISGEAVYRGNFGGDAVLHFGLLSNGRDIRQELSV